MIRKDKAVTNFNAPGPNEYGDQLMKVHTKSDALRIAEKFTSSYYEELNSTYGHLKNNPIFCTVKETLQFWKQVRNYIIKHFTEKELREHRNNQKSEVA